MMPLDMMADPDNRREIADWTARIVMDFMVCMPHGIDWTEMISPDECHGQSMTCN